MRSTVFVLLLGSSVVVGAASAQDRIIDPSEIERDCGTNTGSTRFEACISAKYREVYERQLTERYERIVAYLRNSREDKAADGLVAAQAAWVAYREATCELENEFAPFNSIGWARCFGRMRDERMEYFNEHYNWPALDDDPR